MSDIAIRVEHVSKLYKLYDKPIDRLKESLKLTRQQKYKEHYALRDVSFDIHKGETVGIIGTNGSGKSTILKIITGVLNETSGSVVVNGRISALLELGAGFNMEYTGVENVYLNGTMIGFSEEEITAKLDDILAFADIGEFVHQPVKTYSSGMFVRLAFAVAINIEPEILIVDEALSVGDVFFQAKCYRKFEEFKEMGKTILFVSHDLGSVSKYCDRVVLLNRGEKMAEGEPKEMVDLYKKVLVHQEDVELTMQEAAPEKEEAQAEEPQEAEKMETEKEEKTEVQIGHEKPFAINKDVIAYGDKRAEIADFTFLDEDGVETNTIEKGKKFKIVMRVKFHEDVEQPIYAYTFKDIRGTEITGTNTLFEKVSVPPRKKGEMQEIVFEQRLDMQGGEYLLSLGCTGYDGEDFVVYHRLYDVCNLSVISVKNTVGFYDMNSKVILA